MERKVFLTQIHTQRKKGMERNNYRRSGIFDQEKEEGILFLACKIYRSSNTLNIQKNIYAKNCIFYLKMKRLMGNFFNPKVKN